MGQDDIERRLQELEQQRIELERQISESQSVLNATDKKMADFKQRQTKRIADQPMEETTKQKITEAGSDNSASS